MFSISQDNIQQPQFSLKLSEKSQFKDIFRPKIFWQK